MKIDPTTNSVPATIIAALAPDTPRSTAASAGPARIDVPWMREFVAFAAVSSAGVVTRSGRSAPWVARLRVMPHIAPADRTATSAKGASNATATPAPPVPIAPARYPTRSTWVRGSRSARLDVSGVRIAAGTSWITEIRPAPAAPL
jgi:hypothetical protein